MIKPINLAKILVPLLLLFLLSYVYFAGEESSNLRGWLDRGKEMALDDALALSNSKGENMVEESSPGIFLEGENNFPPALGEMSLTRALKGEEALRNIREFHGDEIDIIKAFIPYYQGSNQQAIIWIAESREKENAKYLIGKIDERVPERDVFDNYSSWVKDDTLVYHVEGMGWYNYYYQKGNRVYWVCIQGEDPREIFNLIFKTL